MSDYDLGDARLRELALLSELSQCAPGIGRSASGTPGPQQDMLVFLLLEGFVEGHKPGWTLSPEDADPFRVLRPGQSLLEQEMHRDRIATLARVLRAEDVGLYITHKGRLRIAELRESLRSNRVREQFGILWDGRHYETDLRIALLEARPDHPISLAYFDMNGLKSINDKYGHELGDKAIRLYFEAVIAGLGPEGEGYRVGGDEVIIVILRAARPEASIDRLTAMCRLLMNQTVVERKSTLSPLSLAVGVAVAKDSRADPEELRRTADTEMFRAKKHTVDLDPRPCSIAIAGENVVRKVV